MKKHIYLLPLFIIWIFFFFSLAAAEEHSPDIEIKQIYPEYLEINPGRAVTVSLLVINHSASKIELKETLSLPPGWQEIIPVNLVNLNASDRQVKLISFVIPNSCVSGSYQVGYSLSGRDPSISFSIQINVTVLPVSAVKSFVEEKPQVVIAGEKYSVKLRYMNMGNCSILLTFRSTNTPDYRLRTDPAEMELQPGESKVLTVNIQTDDKLVSGIKHFLTIKAKDKSSALVYSEDNILVDIIPKVDGKYDLYHRIPSQVKIIAGLKREINSVQFSPALQLESSGSGSIDNAGKNKVDWLLLTPNLFGLTSGQNPGSYRMNYSTDMLSLNAGDSSFLLSPLTGRWDNRNNINLSFYPKNSAFGFIYPGNTELGVYYKYQLNQFANLKLNILNSNNSVNSKLISLESDLKPIPDTVLNLEYGMDVHNENNGDSYAYRFDLHRLSSGAFNYSLEKIHAAPDYFGNYNDIDSFNGSVSYLFNEKFPLSLSIHSHRNNLELDVTKDSAHDELSFNGNLSCLLNPKTIFSLTWNDSRKKDLIPIAENSSKIRYDYEIKSLKLGFQHLFPLWKIVAFFEGGNFKDKQSHDESGFFKFFYFNCNYIPNPAQTYSLYANIGDNNFALLPETTNYIRACADLHFRDNFDLSLDYQKNNLFSGTPEQDSVSLNLTYTINQFSVSLKGSLISDANSGSFTASLLGTYTMPWNIPATKRKDFGVLKGKIFNAEDPDHPPLSNVILRANGITAVSNEQGEFVFSALPPGDYSILIDKSLIGLNMVSTEKLPLIAKIKKGEVTIKNIGMVSACKITGKVVLLTASQEKTLNNLYTSNENLYIIKEDNNTPDTSLIPDELKEMRILPNTLIECSDGKEFFRQMTDSSGIFSFEGMRPGKWFLKVYDNNLPPHFYFEKAGLELDLMPGEVKDIIIKALPQVRAIEIIEEGEIGTSTGVPAQAALPNDTGVIKNNRRSKY